MTAVALSAPVDIGFEPVGVTVTKTPAGDSDSPVELIVVDKFGARVTNGVLRGATLESASWAKNDNGLASFSFPRDGLPGYECGAARKYRELQVWRHGRLVWWGVILRREMDAARQVRIQCEETGWYLRHRNVGKTNRDNILVDPSFEAGPGDPEYGAWVAQGCDFQRDTSQFKLRRQSARLYQSTPLADAYIHQAILGYGATGVGSLLTLAAYCKIDPASWMGEAARSRSMILLRFDPGGSTPLYGNDPVPVLDGDTPRGSWQRFETTIWLPPDSVSDIEVRLYAVDGVIWWDAAELVLMESLSSVSSATDFTADQATIVENLVLHAQNPAVGKDDRNITTNCPLTGVRREKHYQYVEAANIFSAIGDFSPQVLDKGLDWSIEHPDPHSRVFTTWFPQRGTYRPEYALYLGLNCQLEDLVDDGESGRNSIRVQGAEVGGDDPTREEGGFINAAAYDDNLVVEDVLSAKPGTDIDSLFDQARALEAKLEQPLAFTVRVTDADLVEMMFGGEDGSGRRPGKLVPGDTLDVYGDLIDIDDDASNYFWQVVDVTWDVPNDQLLLVLNVAS